MMRAGLFIAAAVAAAAAAVHVIDAAPSRRGGRGAACASDGACAAGLACLRAPGGACGSTCGLGDPPCDGACVDTPHDGRLCLARCTSDADCRADEGYACDPAWRACMIPNRAAIVPRACPAPLGLARSPGFGGSVPLTIASTGAHQLDPAAVVTDDGGLAVLATTRAADGRTSLVTARVDPPGTSSVTLPLFAPRAHQAEPWLARDARGALYAVWLASDPPGAGAPGPRHEIGLATSRDRGATWRLGAPVHDPIDCAHEADAEAPWPRPRCVERPMIAVGPDAAPGRRGKDAVHVLYAADGLRARTSRDGGATFTPARTILAGAVGDVALGADGRIHAVALHGSPHGAYGSAQHRVEYTTSGDGGATFAPPLTVSVRDELVPYYFAGPRVAADARRGWVYVAYARGGRDARWDLVIAASKDLGKTWRRARLGDDPACAIHMLPSLAVEAATGRLHVAWYDNRGGGRFAHAACAAGATACVQRGRIDDAPFAPLSTGRLHPTWLGATARLLFDEPRRALHAVWTQPTPGDPPAGRIVRATARPAPYK